MKSYITILAVLLFVSCFVLSCFAECPSADLTGDCFVDFEDFAVFASCFRLSCFDECSSADLTGDCFVDFEEFAVMAIQWLTTDPCIPDDLEYIPDGTFQMGNSFDEGHSDEWPVHTVTLDSFYMGKYEITNQKYCDFLNSALGQCLITVTSNVVYSSDTNYPYCDAYQSSPYSQINWNGSVFSVCTKGGRNMSNDPMVCVTWYGSAAYCNWRSQQEGKEQCYNLSSWVCDFSKKGYRLATEAEWEYAARGGLSGKRFPWGDTITHSQANYYSSIVYSYDISPTRGYHPTWNDGIYPYTSPVGSFSANGFGLYDMAGNVWGWCNDWYSSTYYSSSPQNNPTGPVSGTFCVCRGFSWGGDVYGCPVATRGARWLGNRNWDLGFRVVLDLN